MTGPSFETFCARAGEGALVALHRELPDPGAPPHETFAALLEGEHAFLLESAEPGGAWARYAYAGDAPAAIFRAKDGRAEIFEHGAWRAEPAANPLDALRALMGRYRVAPDPDLPPFAGGAVGYYAYDGVRYFERLDLRKPDELGLHDCYYLVTGSLAVLDRARGALRLVVFVPVAGRDLAAAYREGLAGLDALEARLRSPRPAPAPAPAPAGEPAADMTEAEFCAAVARCQAYILAGDVFQVVVSLRLAVKSAVDRAALYAALRAVNPSPYMFFLRLGGVDVVGASPERLVRVARGEISSRPIAGTAPRGAGADEDAANAARLAADPKEIAEHVMLVDLARNDIGRVAAPGTVRVADMHVIERYSHVMHLVSDVRGRLAHGADAYDAFRASFPIGTMSGAPKIRAMEIIDEVEPARRGLYAGAVGWFGFDGEAEHAVAIRAVVAKGDTLYVQAGAGIVHDSVPAREYRESLSKARAQLAAILLAGAA